MRLYLDAESKCKIGYIPDWIQVKFEKDKIEHIINFDIQGYIDYADDCLSCRCKGELVPWSIINMDTGKEKHLTDEEAEEYTNKVVSEIFSNGKEFLVGVYIADDYTDDDDERFEEIYKNEFFTESEGAIELYLFEEDKEFEMDFEFKVEMI